MPISKLAESINASVDEAEQDLKRDYLRNKSELEPAWDEISPAARSAWNRVDVRWPPS